MLGWPCCLPLVAKSMHPVIFCAGPLQTLGLAQACCLPFDADHAFGDLDQHRNCNYAGMCAGLARSPSLAALGSVGALLPASSLQCWQVWLCLGHWPCSCSSGARAAASPSFPLPTSTVDFRSSRTIGYCRLAWPPGQSNFHTKAASLHINSFAYLAC